MRRVHPLLLLVLALAFGASEARAQLDLPAEPQRSETGARRAPATDRDRSLEIEARPGGDVAPHLTCTVCFERNYTAALEWGAKGGLQSAWCGVCRAERLHRLPAKEEGSGARIDLPRDVPSEPTPPGPDARPTDPAAGASASDGGAPGDRLLLSRAAETVLAELENVESVDDPRALAAAESLLAFGQAGRAAARVALSSSQPATVMTGLRVLLRSGEPTDADLALRRLAEKLPTAAAARAVEELVRQNPVRATPHVLASLLGHSQNPVRAAAERALEGRLGPDHLPLLAELLESDRSDTRLRALALVARTRSPEVLDLLVEHVDDRSAKVAWRAVEALAASDDPRTESALLAAAFRERWILRPGAYALLAIVEREDRTFTPILGPDHVPPLLSGLDSSDAFVSGTCAAALAGIGFRGTDPAPWLDGPVPERLVAVAVGNTFFHDFSSLRAPALRRLGQIAGGVSYGSDGPAWASWWIGVRERFHASRAVLAVAEGDERRMAVHLRSMEGEPIDVALFGPDRLESPFDGDAGETLYLAPTQARDLLEMMQREGLLGLERPPGVRGGEIHRGRVLEIAIGAERKRFAFGPGLEEPWFERATGMVRALVDQNRWQRYPHPDRHDGSRRTLFELEHEAWLAETSELERAKRLKDLVLDTLAATGRFERDAGLAELEALYAREGVASPADLPRLLALIANEVFLTPPARRVIELGARAAGVPEPSAEPDAAPPAPEVAARAEDLIDVVIERFGMESGTVVADLLRRLGRERVRAAAGDERPLVRMFAAGLLAEAPAPEDVELLLALLRDPDLDVEIAAVLAAGEGGVEAARSELLLRARGVGDSKGALRAAALRAAGRLKGEGALDALVSGLAQADETVQRAAAEGLADLADPTTSPLLVSLLRQGPDSVVFEPAQRGLVALGADAFDELAVALRSPTPAIAREAALVLARQAQPIAASTLIRILTDDPADAGVAAELAVLSCVDHRGAADPASQWWLWWDGVRHDDALSWLRAALEARGIPTPPAEAFQEGGSAEAVRALVAAMRRSEPWLVERARRELQRLVGRDLGHMPVGGPERLAWLATLEEVLTATRQ